MDGELDNHEVAHELARINGDPEREAAWTMYHLIGDALRGENMLADRSTEQIHIKLLGEPTVLAPRKWMRRATRRVALPLAASLCGAAVVAWLALSNNAVMSPVDNSGVQMNLAASSPTSEDAEALSEYLLAHQQFSPSTAMQGVVPYVRTVAATDRQR